MHILHRANCRVLDSWRMVCELFQLKLFLVLLLCHYLGRRYQAWPLTHAASFSYCSLQAPDFLFGTFCLCELLPMPLHFNLLPSASFWHGSICLHNYMKTRGKAVRIMSVGLPSSSISAPYIPKILLRTLT